MDRLWKPIEVMRDVRYNLQAVMSDIINKRVAHSAKAYGGFCIAEGPQAPIGRSY